MTGSMVAITESQDRGRSTRKRERDMKTVSYTHLTLPTN